MLRSWNGRSQNPIIDALRKFGIKTDSINLLKYEGLTPDSFIWYFNITNSKKYSSYCLYAEDYVPSLKHVEVAMKRHLPLWNNDDKYTLVPVQEAEKWDMASPVKAASTYNPPNKKDEFMKYAASSGIDFVFLGKSTKN